MTTFTADQLKRLADEELVKAGGDRDRKLEAWPNDSNMQKMARNDFNPRLRIAELVKAGDYRQAYERLCNVDSVVRDDMHDGFWAAVKIINGEDPNRLFLRNPDGAGH